MTSTPPRLGIISALHQEQAGLVDAMQEAQIIHCGMRDYASGTLWGQPVVCVLSRLGKVAAAATVATLIERFAVTHIVFTGVAGAAGNGMKVGDIVIADTLIQHDMDATPLFPRYQVPLLGQATFASDLHLTNALHEAAAGFLAHELAQTVDAEDRAAFRLDQPALHHGLIASGDEFIDSRARLSQLRQAFPDLLAVEMEGAAVAQVCFEFGLPFAVIRTISDSANEAAPVDFMRFVERVAARYAQGIVQRFLREWGD